MNNSRLKIIAASVISIAVLLAIIGAYFYWEGESTSPEQGNAEAAYIEKAQDYVIQIHSGNIDQLYENMQEELKSAYTYDEWSIILTQYYANAGKHIEFEESTTGSDDTYLWVDTAEKNSLYTISYKIAFNIETSEVAGIYLYPTPTLQEPQSTDTWEEHALTVGVEKYPLNAMLTLPKHVENPPLVIFVHGSGISDMDETYGAAENNVFEDLAHDLAEKGIASLRYDKRTFSHIASISSLTSSITIEFEVLEDINAIVDQMLLCEEINPEMIFVAGHSLGGMLVPVIGTENPELKGVISLAGTLRGMEDMIYDQNMLVIENSDLSDAEKAVLSAQISMMVNEVKNIDENSTGTYFNMPAGYWYSINSYDRTAMAQTLEMPMLILQGVDDFQVYADTDYLLWQEVLANKNNVTYQLYDHLNHMFAESESKKDVIDVSVYDKPARIDERVANDISEWILSLSN